MESFYEEVILGELLLAAVVALGLQACGGGGGGGGGGVGALGLGGLPTDAVTMTVSVNGKVVTPTACEQQAAYPQVGSRRATGSKVRRTCRSGGRLRTIMASTKPLRTSDYHYTNVDPRYGDHGFLKFRDLSITGTKWSAQIVNLDSRSEQGWPITAWLASAPRRAHTRTSSSPPSISMLPRAIRAAEPTSSSAQVAFEEARLDFDAKVYELVGKDASKLTGSFASDEKEPGTYRISTTRTARPRPTSRASVWPAGARHSPLRPTWS